MGKLFISSDKGSLTCGTAVYFHSLLISRPVRNTEDKTCPPLRTFIFNTPLSPRKLGPITRLLLCRGRALQSWLSFSFSFSFPATLATLKKKRKRKRRGKNSTVSSCPFFHYSLSISSLFFSPSSLFFITLFAPFRRVFFPSREISRSRILDVLLKPLLLSRET